MTSIAQRVSASPEPLIGKRPCLIPIAEAKSHAFVITHYRERAFHFAWHTHPEIELVWVRRGCGLRYVGASVEAFQPGDLVLLGGGLPHTWASAGDSRGQCDWTVIHLLQDIWGPGFWRLPELQGLQALITSAGCGVRFLGQRCRDVGRRIERLVRHRPYTLEAVAELLDILGRLPELPHCLLNPSAATEAPGINARLVEVLTLIQQRASGPLTQAECAQAMRMSPAEFSRWFKAQAGRTFQHYLNEVRVANVCAHLAIGKENVTQAAFACGYGGLANFYRRFRQITGLSPGEFLGLTRHGRKQRVRDLVIRVGLRSAVLMSPLEVRI